MTNTSTRRGFTQQVSLLHLREKVAEGRMRGNLAAFTLIELVIAVLIIGILAAVAIPMYKHAMIKSRFSTVMPVAKTIADAQESYYLRNGQYASEQAALDVTPPNVENTTVELSGTEEDADENYAYVVASRSDVPGAKYIQYQKNSPQFAENIHCEALTGEEEPNWLCKALGGEYVGEHGDYTAYLLSGNTTGSYFSKQCTGEPETEQACSGCGIITRGASCNTQTGEWEYDGEFDTSTCPTKPNPEQMACDSGYTGNKTRAATCNSAGTAWEFTGDWNTSACQPEKTVTGTRYEVNSANTAFWYTDYSDGSYDMQTRRCVKGNSAYAPLPNQVCQKGFKYSDTSLDVSYDSHGKEVVNNLCSAFDGNGNCTEYQRMERSARSYNAQGVNTTAVTEQCINISGTTCAENGWIRSGGLVKTKSGWLRIDCNSNISADGGCPSGWRRITLNSEGVTTANIQCSDTSANGVNWETATCN